MNPIFSLIFLGRRRQQQQQQQQRETHQPQRSRRCHHHGFFPPSSFHPLSLLQPSSSGCTPPAPPSPSLLPRYRCCPPRSLPACPWQLPDPELPYALHLPPLTLFPPPPLQLLPRALSTNSSTSFWLAGFFSSAAPTPTNATLGARRSRAPANLLPEQCQALSALDPSPPAPFSAVQSRPSLLASGRTPQPHAPRSPGPLLPPTPTPLSLASGCDTALAPRLLSFSKLHKLPPSFPHPTPLLRIINNFLGGKPLVFGSPCFNIEGEPTLGYDLPYSNPAPQNPSREDLKPGSLEQLPRQQLHVADL
ncbi:uncharacterized protein LOC110215976 [Phascolarctos cinereus]